MDNTKIMPSYDTNRSVLGKILPLKTPFNVIIDASERCNFQCNYCFRSDKDKRKWGYAKDNQLLDWDTFQMIVEQITAFEDEIKQISLSCHGEPLCNPLLPEMVKYIKSKKIQSRISIHTNASLLNQERIDALTGADIDRIVISLQGLSSEKYWKVCHAKVDFIQLYQHLKYLYMTKSHTQIHIKIMDTALDAGEENKFYELFSPVGDRIFIEREVPIWKGVETSQKESDVQNKYGDRFPLQNCCPLIFHTIVVAPNGDVYPCTQLLREDKLGNVKTNSLRELWESEYRSQLLIKQCALDNPEICRDCYIRQNSIYSDKDMIDAYRMDILERLNTANSYKCGGLYDKGKEL